jgi:hypothetical protein
MLCRTADNPSWGDPEVTRELPQATALNGLHPDLLEESDRQRVSTALARAAQELRAEILAQTQVDQWSRSLADYLPVLQMWLEDLQSE